MSVYTSFEGYVIVRRLKFINVVESLQTNSMSKRYYCGLDRGPWDNARSPEALSKLPVESALWVKKVMENANWSAIGVPIVENLEEANRILNIFNDERDDIIAVSDYSRQSFHTDNGLFQWIGFDLFSNGEWSLIKEGIFRHPNKFGDFMTQLNDYGLFERRDLMREYIEHYRSLDEYIAEPIREDIDPIFISVFSMGASHARSLAPPATSAG